MRPLDLGQLCVRSASVLPGQKVEWIFPSIDAKAWVRVRGNLSAGRLCQMNDRSLFPADAYMMLLRLSTTTIARTRNG